LTLRGIFLKRKRPMFLCERLLIEKDARADPVATTSTKPDSTSVLSQCIGIFRRSSPDTSDMSISRRFDSSIRPRVRVRRSSAALLGAFMNFSNHNLQISIELEKENQDDEGDDDDDNDVSVSHIVESAIRERKWSDNARKMYQMFDTVRCLVLFFV
jgi:hypothetical protein